MHAEFAAGIEQTIDHQQSQHLFPTHRFTAFGQTLSPELVEAQLLPKFACQPATTEDARTLQFQPAQAHLHAVDGIGGNFPIVGKQTHGGEALFGFAEYIERLAPRRLLLIVDLAEIENGALRGLAPGQPPVLDHAEIPMILAVLVPVCAAQKHRSAAACQRSISQKRGKVFTWPIFADFRSADVESKRNSLARRQKMPSKCESRASLQPDVGGQSHRQPDWPITNRPQAASLPY